MEQLLQSRLSEIYRDFEEYFSENYKLNSQQQQLQYLLLSPILQKNYYDNNNNIIQLPYLFTPNYRQ